MSVLEQILGSEAASFDQGGDLWMKYRIACADSFYFAAKSVLATIPADQNRISPILHRSMCLLAEGVNRGEIDRLLVEVSRKHLKSTIFTVARPIHKLMRRAVAGEDPCDRFGILSYKVSLGALFWGEIKRIFERNELFAFLFPELIPDFGSADIDKWNQSCGTIPRIYQPKEPTFDCVGRGTGYAFDDITEDDLINEENYDSPSAIEKAVEMHRLSENLIDRRNGRGTIVTVENPWTMRDVNEYIHRNEPDTVIFSVGCLGPRLADRMPETVKNYSRGLPESVREVLDRLPAGEPVWPEVFTREELGRIMRKVRPRIWTAQWLCDPQDPEGTDFKVEQLQSCKVIKDEDGQPAIKYEDDLEPMPFSALNLYLAWDPAMGGAHATSRNGIIVTSIDYKGRVAILAEHAKKEDPRKSILTFLAYAKTYSPWLKASGVEEVLFAKVLGDLTREAAHDRSIRLNIRKIKVPKGMTKDERIRAWVGSYAEGKRLYVKDGLLEFPTEFAQFGIDGATNDLLDALGHASRMFTRPASPMKRLREMEKAERVYQDRGQTGYGSSLVTPFPLRSDGLPPTAVTGRIH